MCDDHKFIEIKSDVTEDYSFLAFPFLFSRIIFNLARRARSIVNINLIFLPKEVLHYVAKGMRAKRTSETCGFYNRVIIVRFYWVYLNVRKTDAFESRKSHAS